MKHDRIRTQVNPVTKRKTHQNVWDNIKGYIGNRQVEDFGTDQADADLWRDDPKGYDEYMVDKRANTMAFLRGEVRQS